MSAEENARFARNVKDYLENTIIDVRRIRSTTPGFLWIDLEPFSKDVAEDSLRIVEATKVDVSTYGAANSSAPAATSTHGLIPALWLPYIDDQTTVTSDNPVAQYLFTAWLTGCRFFVETPSGAADVGRMGHISGAEFETVEQRVGQQTAHTTPGSVTRKYSSSDFMEVYPNAKASNGRLAPSHQTSVIGVREGRWKFYAQNLVTRSSRGKVGYQYALPAGVFELWNAEAVAHAGGAAVAAASAAPAAGQGMFSRLFRRNH